MTGATGQLGSALVRELLDQGHDVTAFVLPEDPWAAEAFAGLAVQQITGNVLERASFPADPFDWVFHLAANQSFWRGDRKRQWAINVDGVANLVDWLRRHPPRRLIHVSSLAAVGLADRPEPMDETYDFDASRLGLMYATSKQSGERLVLAAVSNGLPAVIANPGTVIGPWDRGSHAWRMLRPFARGRIRGVPRGGINLVDVRDVAVGLVALADRGRPGERYLLTGHNLTYRQLARDVGEAAGTSGPIVTVPGWLLAALARGLEPLGTLTGRAPPVARDDVMVGTRFLHFDATKAQRDLGFRVRPLDESLRDSLAWYRQIGLR